jgi:hypothetical protein
LLLIFFYLSFSFKKNTPVLHNKYSNVCPDICFTSSIQIFIKNFCKIILIDNIFCQPYRIHWLTASLIYTSFDKRKKDSYLVAAKLWLDPATWQRPKADFMSVQFRWGFWA